jgi:MoaA/NifB/PqqE/SkfB family radical SAM enzyme
MDFDLYCRIVDAAPQLEELHLQGMGEPLMHPRFFDMVRYAARRGVRVSTNSNLTLLSERRAQACVDSGLHTLHVSLDGATAATYEYIRVRGRLSRVLRNLEKLADAKRRAESRWPEVTLVAVAMRRNLHELPDIVARASQSGAAALDVQHLCHDYSEAGLPPHYRPMRDFVEQETLLNADAEQVRTVFAATRRRAEELGVRLRLPRLWPERRHMPASGRRCDAPWRGPYISYSGAAMPCCMIGTPDRGTLGDLRVASLAEIWSGPSYSDFRRRLASDDPPDVCRGCSVYAGTF